MKGKGDVGCPRCKGLMVPEQFRDFHDAGSGWRCLSCGEVVDPLIMANRLAVSEKPATPVTKNQRLVGRRRNLSDHMAALVLALLIPLYGSAYGQSPEAVRQELMRLNIPYTANEFVERAAMGDTRSVQSFLTAGMDVNARNMRGMTALMAAAEHGHASIVQVLLAKGADILVRNKSGATALMLATLLDRTEIMQLIEKASAENKAVAAK